VRILAKRLNNCNFVLDPVRPQLISIGGLIGVGKSTLAERLAAALGAELIREEYDKNPFLEKVYHGQSHLALDSELFFLGSSAAQLRKDGTLRQGIAVSDYVFFKALVYARQWLDSDALAQYMQVYESVANQVHRPVLILFLEDTVAHCLERIRRRNRPYEQNIDTSFLEAQRDSYEEILARWTACPVIRLNASDCACPEQIPALQEEISYYLAGEKPWKS
jgi:deoxyadenosine/deoxycytidine kinase